MNADALPDMRRIVGTHDVVLVTLDTLRYDVAQAQWQAGASTSDVTANQEVF